MVAPTKSVPALTTVAASPWVFWELRMAPSRIFAVDGPNRATSCPPTWDRASSDPTTQPATVSTMTNRGAIENAQKNASDAAVLEALSATQWFAEQRIRLIAFVA